ncbi:tautomerase family protein [Actinokineospora inagensis]|uniref:tautomerase family protein n=1 Tax=Actinokineospora inagensis TaxID=103730 RepID=UPI00040F31BF|nr:tautomerase family protein [Actinokineospora inagensis]
MPFITVTTWPNQTDEKWQELIEEITATVHKTIGAPLDKITVVVNTIPQTQWGEAGVIGSNPQFARLSRLQ